MTENPLYPVLQCSAVCQVGSCKSCKSEEELFKEIGLFDAPKSIASLNLDNVPPDFDFDSAFRQHFRKMDTVLAEMKFNIKRLKTMSFEGNLDNLSLLEKIKQLYLGFAILRDDISSFEFLYKTGKAAASYTGNSKYQISLEKRKETFDLLYQDVEILREKLQQINSQINIFVKNRQLSNTLAWYAKERQNYAFVFNI